MLMAEDFGNGDLRRLPRIGVQGEDLTEISRCTLQMVDRFFSHQIYEEYTDHMMEGLLETVLVLMTQVPHHEGVCERVR